ncbi:hypothetical protein FH972_020369 [Carpinus fangiana]|uniref:Cytochrome P450 n=1 Tax=Carpinus fangiana TaxID=176857 RepID=A0A5N6RT08_9ROSI|nr:hypothetical protein FH972_020369 [Carpinus fangiana]
MRANTAEKWLEERIRKYGPISKLSLFGKPTVFVYGQAANKFLFSSDISTIGYQQNQSLRKILGEWNIFELSVEDHKRVRGALVSFLKPESLKQYVGKMDGQVKEHLEMHWHGKPQVEVLPLMKTLTFNIICSLIFGVERGARIPVNLLFTRYNRGLKASATVQNMVKDLIREKRVEVEQKGASPYQDLITCLLSTRKDNEEVLTEDEIVHNVMLIMVPGHDTSSVFMTFIMRLLANEPAVYAAVLQAKTKPSEEFLTWEDLTKMKYNWRAAMETLRMVPPAFSGFRKALKDIEYGGYLIPKGWQIFWAIPMTHMDNSIFPEPS